MKNFKIIVLSSLSLFLCSHLFSQNIACRIDFEITGMEGKNILLGVEHADNQIVIDTIPLNNQGEGKFETRSRLQSGIYTVTFPNSKYIELMIEDEQFFSVYTDTSNLWDNLTITGASTPALFLRYQKLQASIEKEKRNLLTLSSSDSILLISKQRVLNNFKDSVFAAMPNSLLSAFIRLQNLPQTNFKREQKKSSLSSSAFMAYHNQAVNSFIDQFPFNDKRMLRTRLLYEKLNYFFNVFISQQADTLITFMNIFLTKARDNEDMYKYLLNFFNNNYRNCQTPEIEKVYVYLAKNYYLNGKAPWADKNFIHLLSNRVEKLEKTVIGSKGSDLMLYTTDDKPMNLYSIDAKNLLLFFWETDCPYCEDYFSQLVQLSKKYSQRQLKIVAIYVHSDRKAWIDFISNFNNTFIHLYDPLKKSNLVVLYNLSSVPFLYLLNDNKTIIAKGKNLQNIAEYIK
jgi:thiol-disulfide isomerase/thioredoxin